ncbi:unnamed protein product [Meloidogyne enterolobii]|uniref:Uncharacterized protein n=1 Tax=Meloidogyne enterolobii TaxID=390850 RepID=A0ACB0YEJ6_MELEN
MERNEGICIAAKRPRGTQCFSSSDCNFHAFCDNGFCICLAAYYPIGGNCLPPALAVGEDPRAYIDPDLLALILKQVNDEQMERQNIEGKNTDDVELSEKWKREVPKSFESENLGKKIFSNKIH